MLENFKFVLKNIIIVHFSGIVCGFEFVLKLELVMVLVLMKFLLGLLDILSLKIILLKIVLKSSNKNAA